MRIGIRPKTSFSLSLPVIFLSSLFLLRRRRGASAASLCAAAAVACIVSAALPARAEPPARPGVGIVRALGPRALAAFAPRGAPGMGALVWLPPGVKAADWGLAPAAPGIARYWGQPAGLLAFAGAHPAAAVEVTPTLRPLLDPALVYLAG